MSMDLEKKTFSTAPEYYLAGTTIGIAKAIKKASAAVAAHAPVLLDSDEVKPIAKVDGSNPLSVTGLYGITADSAEAGEEVPVYLTGEFFADALVLPEGVKAADIEVALRNLGIFLK